jgi:hypothetical protein
MSASKYDPALFIVQRRSGTEWVHVPAASVSYTSDYSLNDNRDGSPPSHVPTLVIGSETATVSITRYANSLPTDILYPADRVQAIYNDKIILDGDVETVTITDEADPAAKKYGVRRRFDISCAVGGFYAHLLSRTVTWSSLPGESWVARLSRFGVNVS